MGYTRKWSNGGSKHTRRVRKARSTRRKRSNQKGGMLAGALTALRQAVLPYLMFKAQKRQQSRVHHRRSGKKSTMKRNYRK